MPPSIDHRYLARMLGMGRIAIGAALLLAPGRAGQGWIGATAHSGGGKVALRALGARDVAIGYGIVRALDHGDPQARQWVTFAGLCDLADSTATILAFRSLPTRGRVVSLAVAAGAAAASLVARDRLD